VSEPIHLGLVPALQGYVKVKLFFSTTKPNHIRSQVLMTDYQAQPPFIEDRSVLIPADRAFNRLSAYRDIFVVLQVAGVVASDDVLKDFEIRAEDFDTLAYYER
jgi:hypothetical protein